MDALALVLIVLYYVLLSWGETWAQQGRLPPGIAIWIPNALLIMLPYLLALLAVGGLVGRQMAPATLGEPYRR